MRDIIFHLADDHMETGMRAFFQRDDWQHALGCHRFDIDADSPVDLFRVAGHTDPGLWKHAHENLAAFRDKYRHAVIVLDADFDPYPGADVLHQDITRAMIAADWEEGQFAVVVIQPELEAWLWAANVNVAIAFGHQDFTALRNTLEAEGLWTPGEPKPNDLKRARDRAAKLGGKKTGGPIFKGVFGSISSKALNQCVEPGFKTLQEAVQRWFPKQKEAWEK